MAQTLFYALLCGDNDNWNELSFDGQEKTTIFFLNGEIQQNWIRYLPPKASSLF